MSEVYCRVCEQDEHDEPVEEGPQTEADAEATAVISAVNEKDIDSPACLATVPATSQSNISRKKKPTNLLNVESELELPGSGTKFKLCSTASKQTSAVVVGLPKRNRLNNNTDPSREASIEELEFGDDVSAGILNESGNQEATTTVPLPSGVLDESEVECRKLTRVHGSEELPVQQTNIATFPVAATPASRIEDVFVEQQSECDGVRLRRGKLGLPVLCKNATDPLVLKADDRNGNEDSQRGNAVNRNYSTLPKMKRNVVPIDKELTSSEGTPSNTISNFGDVSLVLVSHPNGSGMRRKVPMRTTPDGTNIYYWCDMSKKVNKGCHTIPILYIMLKFYSFKLNRFKLYTIRISSLSRAGRWCLQSAVGKSRIHTNVPLLERTQTSAVNATERLPDLRHASMVEHCQRYIDNINRHFSTGFVCNQHLPFFISDLLDHRETPILTF